MLPQPRTIEPMTAQELVQQRLGVDPARIAEFCRRWQIAELSLFGSVLRDDFGPQSDVDVLVRFDDPRRSFGPWMAELQDMEAELASIFARPVDLVLRSSVERSENYIRRRAILEDAMSVYVA